MPAKAGFSICGMENSGVFLLLGRMLTDARIIVMATKQTTQQKARQNQNDANDQQPFRCVECGEAVSHIRRNDCACIRKLRAMSAK
jgi:hypothetical protein